MAGELGNLVRALGAGQRSRRVGRGRGSGRGKTCGRGTKGSGARKGRIAYLGFEGGQMPLLRRIPKRGFHSRHPEEYEIVNLNQLNEKFQSDESVTIKTLHEKGLIKNQRQKVKILSAGEITRRLNIEVNALSKSAQQKIKAAGGTIKTI